MYVIVGRDEFLRLFHHFFDLLLFSHFVQKYPQDDDDDEE
jgi:hypothetical protein